jgi:hypothetical protein
LDPKTGETIESAAVTIVEDVMYIGEGSDASMDDAAVALESPPSPLPVPSADVRCDSSLRP